MEIHLHVFNMSFNIVNTSLWKSHWCSTQIFDLDMGKVKSLVTIGCFSSQVMAGRPDNGRKRGIHCLRLLMGLGPNLNEAIVDMWDTVIPKLIQYLEGNIGHDDILDLLSQHLYQYTP